MSEKPLYPEPSAFGMVLFGVPGSPSFPKLAQRFGNGCVRRNSVSVAGGSAWGSATEVVFRWSGNGATPGRAFPKRCANFGNETQRDAKPQCPLDIKREERNLQPMSRTLQYLTDERGDRTAVVLPISDYEKLLEDMDDLAVVAERRDEPVISHDVLLAELKRDGVL